MDPNELMRQALKALCDREGGAQNVADAAGVSEQYLKQILAGTPLQKTGNPRGVGPAVRKKLETAYPGWLRGEPQAPLPFGTSPPPIPPQDFADRHDVSESDFGVLMDIKLVMGDAEIAEIKAKAERIRRVAQQQLDQIRTEQKLQ